MYWEKPKKAWLTTGTATGNTKLNAFDNALLDAGIGNLNLINLSSVLPSEIEFLNEKPSFLPSTMVPSIYTKICSSNKISSAIGIGIGKKVGLVYEYSGRNISESQAKGKVVDMIKNGFRSREGELKFQKIITAKKQAVEKEKIGSTVAAVIFVE